MMRFRLRSRAIPLLAILPLLLAVACSAPAATPPTAQPKAQAPSATTAPAPAAPTTAPAAPAGQPTASASSYKPTPLSPTVTLKVGLLPSLANSPAFIAIDKGYFKDEGLDVQLVNLQSGAQLLPAMASGSLDAGISSPGAALFNAIGRDIPMKIVADDGQYRKGYGFGAVVVRKDLIDSGKFKDYSDLKGLTIAYTGKGVATQMMVDRMLADHGMTEADIKPQAMGFADMLAALASKQIDVAQETEPFIAQGVLDGTLVRWKGNDELFPNQQQAVLMFPPKLIQEKPQAAKQFMVAWLRGVRDYIAAFGPEKKNQDEIIKIIATNLKAKDPEIFRKAVPVGFDPNGEVNTADLKDQQDWYAKNGMVKEPVKIEDVVDMSFVQYAQQKLGKQ